MAKGHAKQIMPAEPGWRMAYVEVDEVDVRSGGHEVVEHPVIGWVLVERLYDDGEVMESIEPVVVMDSMSQWDDVHIDYQRAHLGLLAPDEDSTWSEEEIEGRLKAIERYRKKVG